MDIVNREKITEVIFENIRDGILVLDRNFKILSVNNSVEKWAKRPPSEIIDKDCREVFHGVNWVCPHCAAEFTFRTGEINVVTQKGDLHGIASYTELSVYPIRNEAREVIECIVFLQDITDRMLCHDEVLRLYNEVTQTKEYLEGIIENSADGIVTSDLNGVITSWNKGAERIYGFTKEEAIGKFMPFVPEFLIDPEWENNQRIRNGEVLKRVETFRKRKDGTMITVSLTLSPVKNVAGDVIGISGISRDISEKKNVEKELIRRNQELSRLFFISSAMRGTLNLDKLLRMILTAVTMGDGLGFNRAILFLVDEDKGVLRGAMGVGPESYDEAFNIWNKISLEQKTLHDIMSDIETGPLRKDSSFDRLSLGIQIPLTENTILTKVVKEKTLLNVENVEREPLSDRVLVQQLGTRAYAAVPLISRNKVLGVLWVDNFFNNRPVTEEDMRFLTAFSNNVASAIENARLFEKVQLTEQELENIFESMSDMVYFVGEDYVVKNINKAVTKRLGKPAEEIIGKKCYEVFHGTKEPWIECPHQKTVDRRRAFVEEVEDPYMGGTFITSSSPIFDMAGEFMGTVNVVSDITELKTLRERVIKTDRMAALGEIAARVAHEIRNPLVSLGGFAKRLEKKLEGNLKEYADIIAKEVERLEAILNDILSFVKETRIMKETLDSNALMEDVISLVGPEIDGRNILLSKEFGEPIELYVDPNRIKDALSNILKNAVQAVGSNGTITVRIYERRDACVFEVKDTGPGISEEDLPFIFDPFFTTKKFGTGLGLTITHRIIEEHDGNIEVDSRKGSGSVFRISIPLRKEK
jgi:PAS domain S-box-containing protein